MKQRLWLKILLCVIGVGFLYPMLWMILTSLKEKSEFYVNPFGLPKVWDLGNFSEALASLDILKYSFNSIIYTFFTCLITLFFGSMLAYCITRMNFRYARQVTLYMSVGLVIPIQVVMIPLYMMIMDMGLKGSRFSLVFPYSAFQMASTVLMLSAFLSTLPKELEEAAAIDGCNVYQAFFRIIFHIIKPAVLTRGMFIFISVWNEFAIAQVLGNSEKLRPIPVALQNFFLSVGVSDWGLIGAAVVMTSFPLVLIYCIGNRQIENALTAGAVLK